MRRTRLIIAIALIITGVIGTLYVWKDLKENPETNGEETIPASNIDKMTIDSNYSNLTIVPAEGNDIQVEWSSNLLRHRQKEFLRYDVDGSTLKIHMAKKHAFFRFHFGFESWGKSKVVIYLPKRLSDLQIKNAVGKTNVSSIHTEHLAIESDAASVNLKNLDTTSATVATNVGSISLNHVRGNVQATSDVGSISGKMDDIDHDWKLSSNVGKINLHIASPEDTSFIANTEVGSVSVFGDDKSYVSKSQKTVVEIKTDVGSISVKKR